MSWLSVCGRAVVAFAATNVDDVFVLTLFFAQKNLKRWHVVVGQYLGLGGLITISLAGYFARLFIPHRWIGLLGGANRHRHQEVDRLKRGNDQLQNITLITFALLIAVWCVAAHYLGNHPAVKRIVDRYGHILVPFVLIGLGTYIIASSG
ncbi:MAG TPA: cadmium resistance transporter [Pyrinomonadaceae bacterium]|nr:cadmium resistance transporter [Pyrinomonadaceae bacterium]